MKKSAIKQKPKHSAMLQKYFLVGAGLMFVMQIVQSIYYISIQLPENPNLNAYFSWFIGYMLVIVLWVVLYSTRSNRALSLTTLFEVTLLTLTVVMITLALGWLTMFIPVSYSNDNFYWLTTLWVALPLMVVTPWLVIIVRRLRASKQW